MTTIELSRAFQAADDAWSKELCRKFGNLAGDIRYQAAGKGEPGSALNQAYLAVEATGNAWRDSVGM